MSVRLAAIMVVGLLSQGAEVSGTGTEAFTYCWRTYRELEARWACWVELLPACPSASSSEIFCQHGGRVWRTHEWR